LKACCVKQTILEYNKLLICFKGGLRNVSFPFLVDQVAQAADRAFQAAQAAYRTKRAMWEKVQQVFDLIPAKSMSAIYRFVATKSPIDYPLLE